MSGHGSNGMTSAKTEVCEPLRWDEHTFPVKKMKVKARIEDGIIHSPYPDCHVPPMSLFALLTKRMEGHGDKTAILHEQEAVSHGELKRRFVSMTAGLKRLGLGRGHRVYARFWTSTVDGLVALCSVMFSGATLIIVPDFTEAEHLASIRHLDITHLLVDSINAIRLSPLLPQLNLKGKLSVEDVPGFTSVLPLQWANEATFRDECDHPDEVTLIAYSSGTSGKPKNIELAQKSLLYYLLSSETSELMTGEEICINTASICTFVGIIHYLSALYSGATFVMWRQEDRTSGLLEAITRHKVTWFLSLPHRVLKLARQVVEYGCGPPPSLRSVVVTGAPLTAVIFREIQATLRPFEFRNLYGAAETCGKLCAQPKGELACDNVGFPLPGTIVKVIDMESGAILGPMKMGEVLARSPGVMKGYYNMPAETNAALDAQGWFHTGDIGYYDEDGRLYLVDRIKYTMVCMGMKVSPCDLEDWLLRHPDVADVAVLGVPSEDEGDSPAAIVVPRPECQKSWEQLSEELKALVSDQLSWYKELHGGIYIADAIPKTETGKIRRRELPKLILSLPRVDRGTERA